MKKIVIMPGGFHPFHAGHLALYRSAIEQFPDADVYVAATADTSQRPFPFEIKQRLARLAGVPADRFVQVKSPFRAEEITKKYDSDDTALIFVRSEKDAGKPPQAGGVKRDGSPAYLQPYTKADLAPFAQQGYMAYLPTVEFGPGLSSATEIRKQWPGMSDQDKKDLLITMYPALQGKTDATQKIQDLFDQIMTHSVNEQQQRIVPQGGLGSYTPHSLERAVAQHMKDVIDYLRSGDYEKVDYMLYRWGVIESKVRALRDYYQSIKQEGQGWAATYNENQGQMAGTPAAGLHASYQERENQPIDEDYVEEKWSEKYKRSIDCNDPKGFSQRAHCAGRKK